MARSLCLLSALVSLLISEQVFADEGLGVLDKCKKSCERSYPLHTYPKEEPLLACKQGCRLSVIEQLNGGPTKNYTQACKGGCAESYRDKENSYACVVGCNSQDAIPSPDSYSEEYFPDQWSFRTYMVYVYPVLDFSKYCHGFMNRVGYYYRMSASYYYNYGDSNSLIVEINEQPREFISVPKFDEVDFVENDGAQDSSYSDGDDSYSSDVVHKGHQWLRCVSQRSGLPFWLLTSTLFLSIFFLIWLCCATATTAPREVGKRESWNKVSSSSASPALVLSDNKPSIVRELMLLDDDSLLEKLPLVKADENEEAAPLPVKVHIDATTL